MKQPDIDISQQDVEYISLKDFTTLIKKDVTPSRYQSRFSLSKLIDELRKKSKADPNSPLAQTIHMLEDMEEAFLNHQDSHGPEQLQQAFKTLILQIFPFLSFNGQMSFIKGPFENYQFRFATHAFEKLLNNDRWELKMDQHGAKNPAMQDILMAGAAVLNTFYQQNVEIYTSGGMMLRDQNTKMERHYSFNVQLEYLEVKKLKPLKKLSQKQIHELLNNLYDEQLWLEYIPPENFEFNGFIIGFLSDVTKAEILSVMKELAADEGGKKDHVQDLNYMEVLVRSFLNMPDLHLGALQTAYSAWNMDISWCLLRYYDDKIVSISLEDPNSVYGRMINAREAVIVEDLQALKHLSPLESKLVEKGFRSLLIAPITNDDGKIVSIFELASPEPYRLSQLTLLHIEEFITLFEMGTNKFLDEMEKSIRLTIQQEFTSIHPSVEWKFRKVAYQYFWQQIMEGQGSTPDPIVFQDVYPLYGQADIVGSSRQRNQAIETDLIENLSHLYDLLKACRSALHFHLLEVYAENVEAHLERLKEGAFVSSDESVIVELLTEQIHPLLRKLRPRFPQLPQEMLDKYFGTIDPELDIVYQQRKAYEDSVSLLNQAISHYLLQEEEKMQEILPHFFEKFQTDGVEYNLYLGQSILEEGAFHSFYLQDFRLWQLIVMCEITRIVAQKSEEFPIKLTTAQLIFVFNNTLSIRFQMDTKQFDVDGAYNVRYEILKKRIDKAYIKGTDERLTQAGKVAIVWIHEKDRQEYQQYLDHLVNKGYIKPEIEELELEKMQGVEGLRATRVTVVVN